MNVRNNSNSKMGSKILYLRLTLITSGQELLKFFMEIAI